MTRIIASRLLNALVLTLAFAAAAAAQPQGSAKTCFCSVNVSPSALLPVPPGTIIDFTAFVNLSGCAEYDGVQWLISAGTGTAIVSQYPLFGFNYAVAVLVLNDALATATWRADATLTSSSSPSSYYCAPYVVGIPVDLPDMPNLRVDSLTTTPAAPIYAGDPLDVDAVIANDGEMTAAGTITHRLDVDGVPAGTRTCAGLAPGATCAAQWTVTPGAGNHTLTVCTDTLDAVAESDENDNCRDAAITVLEPLSPDLTVSYITVNPSVPSTGETAAVTVRFRNEGTVSSGGFGVRLDVPGQTLTDVCPSLAAGQPCDVQFAWTVPQTAGTYTLTAEADPSDLIDESDETNNHRSEFVEVQPALAELFFAVDHVSMTPAAPQVGDWITFHFSLSNHGRDVPALFGPRIDIFTTDGSSTVICSGLPYLTLCGGSVQVLADEPGPQVMTLVADPTNVVAEIDENNNSRSFNYVVDDGTGGVSCQGTWDLVGIGHEHTVSAAGSVLDDCYVYFSANTPIACWKTAGTGTLVADWYVAPGDACPSAVTVTDPADPDYEPLSYTVTID